MRARVTFSSSLVDCECVDFKPFFFVELAHNHSFAQCLQNIHRLDEGEGAIDRLRDKPKIYFFSCNIKIELLRKFIRLDESKGTANPIYVATDSLHERPAWFDHSPFRYHKIRQRNVSAEKIPFFFLFHTWSKQTNRFCVTICVDLFEFRIENERKSNAHYGQTYGEHGLSYSQTHTHTDHMRAHNNVSWRKITHWC